MTKYHLPSAKLTNVKISVDCTSFLRGAIVPYVSRMSPVRGR